MEQVGATTTAAKGAGSVLLTLAAAQFLMTLDSSVMNVSIATVAQDVGTTVTGIQTAITLYTLVMAMLMITGGKVGSMIGRKRAFAIGCVIYGCGSFTTALAKSLGVLIFGWSFLEGVGAALITYASWRWVFAGEVLVVIIILALSRRIEDAPVEHRPQLDVFGAILSALGLGLAVFGILRSSEWGLIMPKPDGPSIGGVSPSIVLITAGILVLWLFTEWERRRERTGREPLIQMSMLQIPQLKGGLIMFFFQFLIQAGVFFVIPLYLSVALGLSAIDTGLRIMPLSVTLLAAAVGIPRYFPGASPRLVVRLGILAMFAGIVILLMAIDIDAGPEIVTMPLLLVGLGIGALASQLGVPKRYACQAARLFRAPSHSGLL